MAGASGALPPILRPVIGPLLGRLLTLPLAEKNKTFFIPLYQKRRELLSRAQNEKVQDEPDDMFQMMMRYAQKERQAEFDDIDVLNLRLCAANFGSMHQTGIQVTNMILNILGSDAEFNTIAILRDEISRVMGSSDDDSSAWTKAKVNKLVKADSVARETLRLNSFGGRAVFRKVMVDGVETDTGVALPKGTLFSFLGQPAQTDNEYFDDALNYDPFRFSRTRETNVDAGGAQSFVTTSAEHLPFGHGRHACPGRFLVDFELKMIIAYLLMNYDLRFPVEYNGKRPPNQWKAEALFPPEHARLLVRRREQKGPV